MRLAKLILVTAVAACSTDHPAAPDSGTQLSCRTSVSDDCASNAQCDQLLETAEHDPSLCPSFLSKCGPYDLVRAHGVDSQQRLYFRGGQLVARVSSNLHFGASCSVGPTSFVEPACDDAPETQLTGCAASAR